MNFGKRISRRMARAFRPDTRERQLRSEVEYWERWFDTQGAEWPGDYTARFDPNLPLQEWIRPYVDQIDRDVVEILDVGAGPMTKLGKVHPSKKLSITAVDLLADDYNAILAGARLPVPIRTERCDAEKLTDTFGNRRFDIVHAENSMDHAGDAVAAVRQMFAMTNPGGFTLLTHEQHEGLNQGYSGLHKWDFTLDAGHFVISGPGAGGARHDITEMFAGEARVSCWLRGNHVYVAMAKFAATPEDRQVLA